MIPPPYHESVDQHGDAGYSLTRLHKTPGGTSVRVFAGRSRRLNSCQANAAVYVPAKDHWSVQLSYGVAHWYDGTPDLDPDALTVQDVTDALGPVLDTLYTRIEPLFTEIDDAHRPATVRTTEIHLCVDDASAAKVEEVVTAVLNATHTKPGNDQSGDHAPATGGDGPGQP